VIETPLGQGGGSIVHRGDRVGDRRLRQRRGGKADAQCGELVRSVGRRELPRQRLYCAPDMRSRVPSGTISD
jgi:hypothetical protein